MPSERSVSVDLSALLELGPLTQAHAFDNLSRSVESVVNAGVERWQRAVMKAPLWDGERRAYAASITGRMTGRFSGEIVSDYKYVEDIESGRPPYDMKRMLNTSLKVRISKKGARYLIIPMRHGSPGSARPMPPAIYAEASQLEASRITGRTSRRSGTGAWLIKTKKPARVAARRYAWGGRLPEGLAPKLKPEHVTDPYAGMVRFQTGKSSSAYLTFRTMSERSSGWIIPAKPGLWLAKNVTESLQRTAEKDFAEAVGKDLGLSA